MRALSPDPTPAPSTAPEASEVKNVGTSNLPKVLASRRADGSFFTIPLILDPPSPFSSRGPPDSLRRHRAGRPPAPHARWLRRPCRRRLRQTLEGLRQAGVQSLRVALVPRGWLGPDKGRLVDAVVESRDRQVE